MSTVLTFEEKVKSVIQEPSVYKRLYPLNGKETVVECLQDNHLKKGYIEKIDLKERFPNPIYLSFPYPPSGNDVFQKLNNVYGLGLVKGIDYYDNERYDFQKEFITFSISDDSYGFCGSVDIYVQDSGAVIPSNLPENDLTHFDFEHYFNEMKLRTILSSTVFNQIEKMFIVEGLSLEFQKKILEYVKPLIPDYQYERLKQTLPYGYVVDLLNDGISDICFIRTQDNFVYPLRFHSTLGDLPVVVEWRDEEIVNDEEIEIDDMDDFVI